VTKNSHSMPTKKPQAATYKISHGASSAGVPVGQRGSLERIIATD
jgi:hypothetical protein